MKNILFDSSAHLGQFCLNNERVRIGCKNMQASLVGANSFNTCGAWTDLENGRVDRTIWNIDERLQNAYYPFLDRLFTIASVDQSQISAEVESIAHELRSKLPTLSVYSRFNKATSIVLRCSNIYTLFAEMFDRSVQEYLKSNHGIQVKYPHAEKELAYSDPRLEAFYQSAITQLRTGGVDLLSAIADERSVLKQLSS